MQKTVPITVFRGGTSRGLFFLEADLPPAGKERDTLLLRCMGSGSPNQIDGLGGAQAVTSKVAIIGPSEREDADVNYTFAQVSVDKPVVSYLGNCGNISSAVGPFAIESGLVKASQDVTIVRVFNTNTQKVMVETVQTPNAQVTYEGDYSIAGVPGCAAPIKIKVLDPAGSVFKSLLPTNNVIDTLDVPSFGKIEVSIVDAANPFIFIRAKDIGFNGTELPADINGSPERLKLLENIRGSAAKLLGLVDAIEDAALKSSNVPKLAIISEPVSYKTIGGESIDASQIDVTSRMMAMQKSHPSYAMTGGMCTSVAAVIPGTIVNELKSKNTQDKHLRIGHPSGVIEASVEYENNNGSIHITSAEGYRTARLLFKGVAYY
ncbi:3-methylitaconate isomerase [Entomomonas moraniae]|uniref:3-methylitaconate isomerase n=1 Tax=Entomomonas moraniae TaxID=2213226 RepID=A0A3Q9JMC9_9GAMM|nr:PrpF domain-containing protein [Entomomonas moraniae]AZS49364.1 3-methylitaconate isomerase [Entomomonas moraniae]